MLVVYLSCALSAPTWSQHVKNARRANRQAWQLMQRGYAVINPALSAFYERDGGDLSWDRWLRHDEAIIDRVDVVYRLLPHVNLPTEPNRWRGPKGPNPRESRIPHRRSTR